MNILVLTTSYPSDAADASGAFVHQLVCALGRRGHRLRVIVPGGHGVLGRRELDGVPVRHVRYALRAGGHGLTSTEGGIPEALRRGRWAACQVPVMMARFAAAAMADARWTDLLYANWLGAAVAGGVARTVGRVPMVVTLRGDDAYLIRDRRLWRGAARWVFRRCEAVTVVSRNMVELVEPVVPPRVRPVIVPTFGVDLERFRPARADEGEQPEGRGGPAGLFVGNVSRAKGVDVLLGALASCPEAWGRFTFAGAGPDTDAMRHMAAELGIGDRVAWLGRRPVGEIPDLMRAHDFLVLPSLSEGRPNVVIEAMASGLPVVATTVGGTPDLVADGQTGLLAPPGDQRALAEAVGRLARDAELRRRLGRAARQFVERENLSWDRTAGEFETIFLRAVAGSR